MAVLFYAIFISLFVYFIVHMLIRLICNQLTTLNIENLTLDEKSLSMIDALLSVFICLYFVDSGYSDVASVWITSAILCVIYSYIMYQVDKQQAIENAQLREKERAVQKREATTFDRLKSRFLKLDIDKLKQKYPSSTIVFRYGEGKTNDFTFVVSRVFYDALKDSKKVTGRSLIVELLVKNHQDTNSSINLRTFYVVDEQLNRYQSDLSLSDSVSQNQNGLEISSNIRPGCEGLRYLVFDVNPDVEAVFLATKKSTFGEELLFSLAV